MSARGPLTLDFVSGITSKTPCCLSDGDTVDFGKPRRGETCVSLGVGEGDGVIAMAKAVGKRGFVYGMEMSKDIMKTAQTHIDSRGYENVELLHTIFETLELSDRVADLVVSDCSIALAQHKSEVWDEIYRILKPGGRFVVADFFSESPIPVANPFRLKKALCVAELLTKDGYLDILDQRGFERVTIWEESDPHPVSYLGNAVGLSSFVISGRKPRRFDDD